MTRNYSLRTDLILEENITEDISNILEEFDFGIKRREVIIKTDLKLKKRGLYYSIETDAIRNNNDEALIILRNIVKDTLNKVFEKNNINKDSSLLIVGLGNNDITPDSLGPKALDNIMTTRHLFILNQQQENMRNVCQIVPGVMGQTGIETADIIKGVIKEIKPDCLLVIDALAARNINNIAASIQITDAGINPGSGVGNNRTELSYDSLGTLVIAIGVPLVIDVAGIVADTISVVIQDNKIDNEKIFADTLGDNYNMFVCPKDIDLYIDLIINVVSGAINDLIF